MTPGSRLLHPIALAAIAVLVLNDHVLKDAYGNALTGKLSDVAGLLFFPLMLQAGWELARDRVTGNRFLIGAAVATALVFASVQLNPLAADAYRYGLGALQWPVRALMGGAYAPVAVTPDPTDLLALPAAAAAVVLGWSPGLSGGRSARSSP